MAKLLIIPEDRLRDLLQEAVEDALEGILQESASLDVDVSSNRRTRVAPPTVVPQPSVARSDIDEAPPLTERPRQDADALTPRPYVIGRAAGQYTYADVVASEVLKPLFSIDEAWEAIRDKIETESSRARESTRRSLDSDDRFERVPERKDLWYRRLDMDQLTMDEGG